MRSGRPRSERTGPPLRESRLECSPRPCPGPSPQLRSVRAGAHRVKVTVKPMAMLPTKAKLPVLMAAAAASSGAAGARVSAVGLQSRAIDEPGSRVRAPCACMREPGWTTHCSASARACGAAVEACGWSGTSAARRGEGTFGSAARTGHHTQSHGPHPRHQSHRAQPSFHPLGLGLQLGALRCGCLRRLGVADGALVVPVAEHGEANEANESQR